MFKAYEMMQTAVKHNAQGGEGSPKFRHLFSAEELGNRGGAASPSSRWNPASPSASIRTPAMAKPISSSKAAQP